MQHLDRSELKALLKAIPQTRNRLMILVGFHHGLRVSELTALTPANAKDGYLSVQRLKGSMRTIQPFVRHEDPELDEHTPLTQLVALCSPTEKLFPMTRSGVDKLIKRAGTKAGIPRHKLHPHVLKHSIACQTIQKAGIENVRQWLGHKSIASTGAYLRVTDEAASRAIHGALSN